MILPPKIMFSAGEQSLEVEVRNSKSSIDRLRWSSVVVVVVAVELVFSVLRGRSRRESASSRR